jgi:hypothetical protein
MYVRTYVWERLRLDIVEADFNYLTKRLGDGLEVNTEKNH